MSIEDAMYELFGPLPRGAPGDDASTLRALERVPGRHAARRVLDLGVGHGRTTLALAHALPDAEITAIEIHAPFVDIVARRAREAGIADRVHAVCASMDELDIDAGTIDLVWAEGSIYVVGVEPALAAWRPWLRAGGCVGFSDFCWWTEDPPAPAREFWSAEYPDMVTDTQTCRRIEAAGYRVVDHFRLPQAAHDAYYVPLAARVADLSSRTDEDMAMVLESTRAEIDVTQRYSSEAGYTFFVARRTGD